MSYLTYRHAGAMSAIGCTRMCSLPLECMHVWQTELHTIPFGLHSILVRVMAIRTI